MNLGMCNEELIQGALSIAGLLALCTLACLGVL